MHIWQVNNYEVQAGMSFSMSYAPDAYEAARADFLTEAKKIAPGHKPMEWDDGTMRAENAVDVLTLEKVELRTEPTATTAADREGEIMTQYVRTPKKYNPEFVGGLETGHVYLPEECDRTTRPRPGASSWSAETRSPTTRSSSCTWTIRPTASRPSSGGAPTSGSPTTERTDRS